MTNVTTNNQYKNFEYTGAAGADYDVVKLTGDNLIARFALLRSADFAASLAAIDAGIKTVPNREWDLAEYDEYLSEGLLPLVQFDDNTLAISADLPNKVSR